MPNESWELEEARQERTASMITLEDATASLSMAGAAEPIEITSSITSPATATGETVASSPTAQGTGGHPGPSLQLIQVFAGSQVLSDTLFPAVKTVASHLNINLESVSEIFALTHSLQYAEFEEYRRILAGKRKASHKLFDRRDWKVDAKASEHVLVFKRLEEFAKQFFWNTNLYV